MRGNRLVGDAAGDDVGSIPACAGEPCRHRWRGIGVGVYPRVCGGTDDDALRLAHCHGLSPRVRGNPLVERLRYEMARSIPACAGEPSPSLGRGGHSPVYPRVCGGTSWAVMNDTGKPGLSPRVRGNRCTTSKSDAGRGSIPACAGEPRRRQPGVKRRLVYPRVCGGTRRRSTPRWPPGGLSPRVRGNPLGAVKRKSRQRSIPACAGEPRLPRQCPCGGTVYPRVCGGTGASGRVGRVIDGLSPRVRGNRTYRRAMIMTTRSIPACAGEPITNLPCERVGEVYPRVCGGTSEAWNELYEQAGLSPRVRGNRRRQNPTLPATRSIPACAGEPGGCPWSTKSERVYPRVCGGTDNRVYREGTVEGLSPRVRGNLLHSKARYPSGRSIPACAGEPRGPWLVRLAGEVYPRVCGGTGWRRNPKMVRDGLSPRVRGNPGRRPAFAHSGRSIPACAGEPPCRWRRRI